MIPVVQFYQAYVSPIVRSGILFLPILGLWIALRRAGLTPKQRMTGILTTGLLLIWWVTIDQLARSGFYASNWTIMRPLFWAIAVAWCIPLLRSKSIGAALDAVPPWWLIALQVYRAGGGLVWLAALAAGRLPAGFALSAGIGDFLVGLFAVPVAVWVYSGARGGHIAGIAWNVFGLLDFATAFVIGSFLTYHLPYPGAMIPAFFAPLSLDFHALSLRQLQRGTGRKAARRDSNPEARGEQTAPRSPAADRRPAMSSPG